MINNNKDNKINVLYVMLCFPFSLVVFSTFHTFISCSFRPLFICACVYLPFPPSYASLSLPLFLFFCSFLFSCLSISLITSILFCYQQMLLFNRLLPIQPTIFLLFLLYLNDKVNATKVRSKNTKQTNNATEQQIKIHLGRGRRKRLTNAMGDRESAQKKMKKANHRTNEHQTPECMVQIKKRVCPIYCTSNRTQSCFELSHTNICSLFLYDEHQTGANISFSKMWCSHGVDQILCAHPILTHTHIPSNSHMNEKCTYLVCDWFGSSWISGKLHENQKKCFCFIVGLSIKMRNLEQVQAK